MNVLLIALVSLGFWVAVLFFLSTPPRLTDCACWVQYGPSEGIQREADRRALDKILESL